MFICDDLAQNGCAACFLHVGQVHFGICSQGLLKCSMHSYCILFLSCSKCSLSSDFCSCSWSQGSCRFPACNTSRRRLQPPWWISRWPLSRLCWSNHRWRWISSRSIPLLLHNGCAGCLRSNRARRCSMHWVVQRPGPSWGCSTVCRLFPMRLGWSICLT